MTFFAVFLAAFWWGVGWAVVLQFTAIGQWMVRKRTWITVVIGMGVNMGLAKLIIPWEWWWPMMAIVSFSAVGIVARSLMNEWAEWMELLGGQVRDRQEDR